MHLLLIANKCKYVATWLITKIGKICTSWHPLILVWLVHPWGTHSQNIRLHLESE